MILLLLACTGGEPPPTRPPVPLPERFQGSVVFEPEGPATATVVTLHGSEGCDAPYNAAFAEVLATRGFRTVAFCWYGGEGLPERLHEVSLDRTVDLLEHTRALYGDEEPRFVYGVSRGAEHVVLLASLLASTDLVDGIATHAASDTVVAAFDPANGGPVIEDDGQFAAAWTWGGAPLHGERAPPFGSGPPIALEAYPGPVYLSHGALDEVWPAARSERLAARREAAGGLTTELTIWPGEGHVLSAYEPLLAEVSAFIERHAD